VGCEEIYEPSGSIKGGEFLDQGATFIFSRWILLHGFGCVPRP